MNLAPEKNRSPHWLFILALVLAAIVGFRVHWLLFPPQDPEFSWAAMTSPRDVGYIEVESWSEGEECETLIVAPNGSVYPITKGCPLRESLRDWKLTLRLACIWEVEAQGPLGIFYLEGRHSNCRVLDIQYDELDQKSR